MTEQPDIDAEEAAPVKRKRRRREPMPVALKQHAAKAGRQHAKRYPAPALDVVASGKSWDIASPFRSDDEADWWRLLGEAFGTRTKTVIATFLDQLAGLVSWEWDKEAGCSMPHANELQSALSIVAAMKPRNEAEAAQAAQAFALHMAAMKTGAAIARRSEVDPRQANALANLVKAYSGVQDSLKRGRSSRSTKQTIVVRKDVRIHNDNRQVHVHPGRGGGSVADRPDEAETPTRGRARGESAAGRTYPIGIVAAVPGPPEADVGALPGSSDAEQDGLPVPRWGGGRP